MANYLKPSNIPSLPQGQYDFLPRVQMFSDYLDASILQDDINAFLALTVPDADVRYSIDNIVFNTTLGPAPAAMKYSAMVQFTRVTNI